MDLKRIKNRVEGLRRERLKYEERWRDIEDFIFPNSTAFVEDYEKHGDLGDDRILNTTPTVAHRVLASGLQSGITSPSRPWFKLSTQDMALNEDQEVKVWLKYVEDLLYEIFARSNFYKTTHQFYQQLAGPGTAALHIDEDYENIITCRSYDIGSYWIQANKTGVIDTFVRCCKMPVVQLVKKFGLENCSSNVQNSYHNGDLDTAVKVWNAIVPNDEMKPNAIGAKGKPYLSLWWEEGDRIDDYLGKSFYEEFPVKVTRWDVPDGHVYARSPSWTALSDCKMLQQLEHNVLLGADRLVDSPLVAPSTAQGKIDVLPGGITYFDENTNGATIRPLFGNNVAPQLQYIEQKIGRVEQRINSAYFVDLFLMITTSTSPQMTAREVVERHEEKLIMLGPVIERAKFEFLDPVIDRVFGIAYRRGLIPPAPEALQGMPLKVDYISVLAQAQKMVGLSGMNELLGMVGNVAQAIPQVLDKIDADQFVDEAARMLGVPPSIVRSDEQVAQLRQERQQAQQQQMAEQQAMEMANTAPNVARAVKDIGEVDTEGIQNVMRGLGM